MSGSSQSHPRFQIRPRTPCSLAALASSGLKTKPLKSWMTPSLNEGFLYHPMLMTIFGCTAARSLGTSSDVQKRACLPLYWKLVICAAVGRSEASCSLDIASLGGGHLHGAPCPDRSLLRHELRNAYASPADDMALCCWREPLPIKRVSTAAKKDSAHDQDSQRPHHQRRQQIGQMEARRIQKTYNRGIEAGYLPIALRHTCLCMNFQECQQSPEVLRDTIYSRKCIAVRSARARSAVPASRTKASRQVIRTLSPHHGLAKMYQDVGARPWSDKRVSNS